MTIFVVQSRIADGDAADLVSRRDIGSRLLYHVNSELSLLLVVGLLPHFKVIIIVWEARYPDTSLRCLLLAPEYIYILR